MIIIRPTGGRSRADVYRLCLDLAQPGDDKPRSGFGGIVVNDRLALAYLSAVLGETAGETPDADGTSAANVLPQPSTTTAATAPAPPTPGPAPVKRTRKTTPATKEQAS